MLFSLSHLKQHLETTKTADLTAYAGQSIYVAFRDVSNDKFTLYFDNVQVIEVAETDVRLQSVAFNRYVEVPTTQSLQLEVVNNGSEDLMGYDVEWSYGGNSYNHTVTGINLAYNEMHTLTTDVDITVDQADEIAFTVSVKTVIFNVSASSVTLW